MSNQLVHAARRLVSLFQPGCAISTSDIGISWCTTHTRFVTGYYSLQCEDGDQCDVGAAIAEVIAALPAPLDERALLMQVLIGRGWTRDLLIGLETEVLRICVAAIAPDLLPPRDPS